MSTDPPRLLPERPFPPYAFIGEGRGYPHPRHDPAGHSHDAPELTPPRFDPERWWDSPTYLCGIDLFNYGYYWEAHEEWEGLWVAAGKRGPVSEFFKGLIKLAAAGVKVRQGQPAGVQRHGARAAEHFRGVGDSVVDEGGGVVVRFGGFALDDLVATAHEVADPTVDWPTYPEDQRVIVFERVLAPDHSSRS